MFVENYLAFSVGTGNVLEFNRAHFSVEVGRADNLGDLIAQGKGTN